MRATAAVLAGLVLVGCASTSVDRADPPTTSTSWTTSTTTTAPPTTEPPTATTTAPPAPVTLSTGDTSTPDDCWVGLARSVGWPEDTLPTLQRIIRRESKCDPYAYADRPSTMDNSRGLLQMNAYGTLDAAIRTLCGVDPVELFDPTTNLRCGLAYYRAAGWAPWGGGA